LQPLPKRKSQTIGTADLEPTH